MAVRVRGTADANALKSARLEVGQGDNPKTWKRIGPATQTKGPDEALGDVPASAFAGAKGLAHRKSFGDTSKRGRARSAVSAKLGLMGIKSEGTGAHMRRLSVIAAALGMLLLSTTAQAVVREVRSDDHAGRQARRRCHDYLAG